MNRTSTLFLGLALLAGCPAQQKVEPAEAGAEAEGAAVEAAEAQPEEAASAITPRGDDAERKSKNGHLAHTVAGVAIDVRFGRPLIKGRTVWGELVPMGKVWRTGADEATAVSFDKDVTVNGSALPAGVYSLFTIPNEGEWTVVFNKTAKQWGAYDYDEAQDALRVMATPAEAEAMEAMNIEGTETGFVVRWDKVSVPVTVAAAAAPAAEAPAAEATEGGEADEAPAGDE